MIIAIDPGTTKSAYLIWSPDSQEPIVRREIVENSELLNIIEAEVRYWEGELRFRCEGITSYGMAVGQTTFETCQWIGRFHQKYLDSGGKDVEIIPRHKIKMFHCGSTRAKDTNIRSSLIDRLGEPGTKKSRGVTYGIKSHLWSALAVAVYSDPKQSPLSND